MAEADRIELGLRDRAGDECRSGGRTGKADGNLQRIERSPGPFERRMPRNGFAAAIDPDQRQRPVETGGGLFGAGNDLDRPLPDGSQRAGNPDCEERRQAR
jgi:hypothetical protein